jgi:hypothetical protein
MSRGRTHTLLTISPCRNPDPQACFVWRLSSCLGECETLEIAALIEAGQAALGTPDIWVPVPKV